MIRKPNWIEINLDNLQKNLTTIKSYLSPDTKVLFPVKADAYGHGSLACSFAAERIGIGYLGVAHVFEGVALRQYGIKIPILVFSPINNTDFETVVKYNLTPTLCSLETAKELSLFCHNRMLINVHIKVNTGMNRYGIQELNYQDIQEILALPNFKVEGIFSHYATAESEDKEQSISQSKKFSALIAPFKDNVPLRHIANSAGLANHNNPDCNVVRPGLMMYGYTPFQNTYKESNNLYPVMKIKARVQQIIHLAKGDKVSYGAHWEAPEKSQIAAVSIGYGDGYFRGNVNDGALYIQGIRCPIVGRVCMDTTMVDVTHLDMVDVGDEVDVINHDTHEEISMEAIASRNDTIAYEISCSVARRLYRKYIWQNQSWKWDTLKEEFKIKSSVEPYNY